jgi:hypothetical protein
MIIFGYEMPSAPTMAVEAAAATCSAAAVSPIIAAIDQVRDRLRDANVYCGCIKRDKTHTVIPPGSNA